MDLDSLGSCDSGPTVANGFDSVESLLVSSNYFKITKIIKWTRRTQLIKDNEMLRPPRPSCAKKPFYRTQSNAPIDYWYGGLILTKKFLFTDSAKFILSIFCRKSHFLQILENQQISIQFCYSTEGSLSRFKSYQSP